MTLSPINGQLKNTGLEPTYQHTLQNSSTTSVPEGFPCGDKVWEKHLGSISYKEEKVKKAIDDALRFPSRLRDIIYDYTVDIPPLPSNINEILESPCLFHPNKKVWETHLLTLIPKTVDGKPFNLNLLNELIQHPKEKDPMYLEICSEDIKKGFGDAEVEKPYWILMTKSMPSDSTYKTYDQQKRLIQNRDGYELPGILEAVTSILMHYFKTDEKLYETSYLCRCKETMKESQNSLVFGYFSNIWPFISHNRTLPSANVGTAAVRKL